MREVVDLVGAVVVLVAFVGLLIGVGILEGQEWR